MLETTLELEKIWEQDPKEILYQTSSNNQFLYYYTMWYCKFY